MSHPLFNLSGKTALVTGSSRRLGLAIAEGLAQACAGPVLNGVDEALAEWDKVLTTNLTSAFLVDREATRRMIPRGRGGKIINIGSLNSEAARHGGALHRGQGRRENAHACHGHRNEHRAAAEPGFRRLGERPHAGQTLGPAR